MELLYIFGIIILYLGIGLGVSIGIGLAIARNTYLDDIDMYMLIFFGLLWPVLAILTPFLLIAFVFKVIMRKIFE